MTDLLKRFCTALAELVRAVAEKVPDDDPGLTAAFVEGELHNVDVVLTSLMGWPDQDTALQEALLLAASVLHSMAPRGRFPTILAEADAVATVAAEACVYLIERKRP